MSLRVLHIFVETRFSLTLKLKFKPFCDQPDVTSCSSHFRWNTVLINPQIEISTFLWPTKCHFIFFIKKSKQNVLITSENLSIGIIWISSEWVCFESMSKWFLFVEKLWNSKNSAWKQLLVNNQTFLHIASSPNLIWILAGMIKLGAIKNI